MSRFYVETDISKVSKEDRNKVAKAILALREVRGLKWEILDKSTGEIYTDVNFEEDPYCVGRSNISRNLR